VDRELVGSRCIVRPFGADDAASVAAAANDRRIWAQLRDLFPYPYALTDAEAYIARVGAVDPPRSQAIVVDGHAVGGVGLELMSDVNRRTAEIGYWLGVETGVAVSRPRPSRSSPRGPSTLTGCCGSSPSRSPRTARPAACSRRRATSSRARCGAAP